MNSENDVILRRVRPYGGEVVDMRLADGVISAIGDAIDVGGAEAVDGGGAIALPALIDAHMHLDKTLWGLPWQGHPAGPSRADRIAADRGLRRDLQGSIEDRAGGLVCQAVRMGTGALRSHVDVEPELGLRHVEALLAVRETLAEQVQIQLVAFPQFGLMTCPGTEDVMAAALGAGVEVVGGIDPSAIDGDPKGQLDVVFDLAERFGAMIDIHLHETGEEGARSMEMICERARALGMRGQVAISHAFCLGSVDASRQAVLVDGLAEAGVSVITYAPGASPVPDVKKLKAAGVTLAVGSDGIRDAWTPYGDADMLGRAMMLAYRSGYRRDEDIELCLDVVIRGGAQVLGLDNVGLDVGCRADVLLIEAGTVAEAVVTHPKPRTIIKAGRVVAPLPPGP